MTHYYGKAPSYGYYDDYDDTPPLQKWLRSAWESLKEEYKQGKVDAKSYAYRFRERPGETSKWSLRWLAARLCSIPGLLIIIWLLVLQHGEHTIFNSSIERCDWPSWERWSPNANPHRLVFVADPQLVDPHTYPGRPWPLSTLTVKHSDLYMRRSYSRIQQSLTPDTIVFLGDLFDGGREWSTPASESVEERYHRYGDAFWQKEYRRFSRIFLRDWTQHAAQKELTTSDESHIRIIASLPGNHDLGFGQTMQIPVRERFNAFFGDSNRIDIIGNHTVVSVDTVSLSAMDDDRSDPAIWHPAHDFLTNAQTLKAAVIEKHLRHVVRNVSDLLTPTKHAHLVEDIDRGVTESHAPAVQGAISPDMPTILLTHVPLDRPPGQPCGPLRERWPPTPPPRGQIEPLDPDERNALPSLGRGWQYQNALSSQVTKFITDSLGSSISHAFSGDDHDFCEIVHRGYSSPGTGIKEITVKSLSWTMGVRKPGFLLVSLWNEIDEDGRHITQGTNDEHQTVQSHLCLLPDQLSILIGYGVLLGASFVLLALQSTYILYLQMHVKSRQRAENGKPLLPTSDSTASSAELEKMNGNYQISTRSAPHSQASSSSSDDTLSANISARTASSTRPRSVSPLPSYGFNALPPASQTLVSQATNRRGWETADTSEDLGWGAMRSRSVKKPRLAVKRSLPARFGLTLGRQFWLVARVVLVWYIWLLYR